MVHWRRGTGASGVPNFVVIGAQKAASTAMLHALREHPDVFMPPQEDPFFRDPLFDPSRLDEFYAGYGGRHESAVGLKCPDYLGRPEVPARLAAHLDRPRLIAVLRNPVARAVSAYYWHVRWGLLPVEHVNVGLRRVMSGEHPTDPTAPDILRWGLYHEHLSRYLQHVDREHLLVVHDVDLRADPGSVMRDAFAFLGVDPAPSVTPGPAGANEGVYALPRLRFLQRRNHLVLTWHESGDYGNIHPAEGTGARVVSAAVAGIDRFVLSRVHGNARPVLDPGLQADLQDYYRQDCAALAGLLGRPNPRDWPGGGA